MNGESCMVGYRLHNTLTTHGSFSRGICEIQNGYLSTVVEHLNIKADEIGAIQYADNAQAMDMTGDEICSMNFRGCQPNLFDTLEEKVYRLSKTETWEMETEWYIPDIIQEAFD